jgi:AcrR family transcriptional regulator
LDDRYGQYNPIMDISIPYESTGRVRQKARTRAAMTAAASALLAEGMTPTVEQAAERAGVSRTTAYRYFPNQRSLLVATYPELGAESLIGDDAPDSVEERLEIVTRAIGERLLESETELRTMLRLSLEPGVHTESPLRTGRAVGWIEDALAPLRDSMPSDDLRRLVLSIRATLGIESLVWLTDIAQLPREQAVELMRSSARTLLRAALAEVG